MRLRYFVLFIGSIFLLVISDVNAFAQDALIESWKRLGFWHLHQTITTTGGAGDSHLDQSYDRCIDLRNPAPPKPIVGWSCPEFNVQKTETHYRFQATCTFPNNGNYTGYFEYKVGRQPTVSQEATTSQTDRYGRFVKTHLVRTGKLVGACPVGTLPIPAAPAITPPDPRER